MNEVKENQNIIQIIIKNFLENPGKFIAFTGTAIIFILFIIVAIWTVFK